jgi:CHASE2 domain-containing sensor protein
MNYSNLVQFVLFGLWAVGSLLLAWFVRRRFYVYFGSVALVAPAISYAMLQAGLAESGGILQALCAGVYPLGFHYYFQRYQTKRRQRMDSQ